MRERLRRAGPAPDQPDRGRHELRDARARPAAARLRPAPSSYGGIDVRCARSRRDARSCSTAARSRSTRIVLVIADARGPVGLAGVMGGENSGIAADTTDVFLEVAFFPPDAVAGRARRYRLRHRCLAALRARRRSARGRSAAIERATQLLRRHRRRHAGPTVVTQVETQLPKRPSVALRPERVQACSGSQVPRADDRRHPAPPRHAGRRRRRRAGA